MSYFWAVLLLVWLPLSSAVAGEEEIAKSPEVAVVTKMELGDVACYLSYRNAAGEIKEALAAHEICSQVTLLNKTTELTFERSRVLGDGCEGDPECKDLKTVWLVVALRPVAEQLCRADEVLYEGCLTKRGETIAFCTKHQFRGQIRTLPDYFVVRVGTAKGIQIEVSSTSNVPFGYTFERFVGANTRRSIRWVHASKTYLFESSYLNGNTLHGLSIIQNGTLTRFEACSDHDPGEEELLRLKDL